MEWKVFGKEVFGKAFTFLIGFLIGSKMYGNPYVWGTVIIYVVILILIKLFAGKATELKNSTDKKITARNMAVEGMNKTQDYVIEGHSVGGDLFDKWYPKVSFLSGVGLFILLIFMLIFGKWIWAMIVFFVMMFYIILNNVWRKVKYLGGDKYGSK